MGVASGELSCPFRIEGGKVTREWLDANGHMNVAWYISSASDASFSLLESLGVDGEYRSRVGASFFTLETQIRYRREVREGSVLSFEGRVLDCNGKLFHVLWLHYARGAGGSDGDSAGVCDGEAGDYVAAISEWIYGYVDLRTRRVREYPRAIGGIIEGMREGCKGLDAVEGRGEPLGLRKK